MPDYQRILSSRDLHNENYKHYNVISGHDNNNNNINNVNMEEFKVLRDEVIDMKNKLNTIISRVISKKIIRQEAK